MRRKKKIRKKEKKPASIGLRWEKPQASSDNVIRSLSYSFNVSGLTVIRVSLCDIVIIITTKRFYCYYFCLERRSSTNT
jgi:hypothetical protein